MSVIDPNATEHTRGVPSSPRKTRNEVSGAPVRTARGRDSLAWVLEESDDPRWVAAMENLRRNIRQNPKYNPDILIQDYHESRLRARKWTQAALGLGLVGMLVTAIWFGYGMLQGRPWVTYERGAAQMDPIRLRDGSVLQLNSRSRVSVNVTGPTRRVVLNSGQALFDVHPDGARFFDVEVGVFKVVAKGTSFALRKVDDNEIEALVSHGSVEVDVPRAPRVYRGAPESPPDGQETRTAEKVEPTQTFEPVGEVKAGQVAEITANGHMDVNNVKQTDIDQRLAWANQFRWVTKMTLEEAVALFNQYNVRKLEIADPRIANWSISGRYHLTEPDRFAEQLEGIGVIHETLESVAGADARILLKKK